MHCSHTSIDVYVYAYTYISTLARPALDRKAGPRVGGFVRQHLQAPIMDARLGGEAESSLICPIENAPAALAWLERERVTPPPASRRLGGDERLHGGLGGRQLGHVGLGRFMEGEVRRGKGGGISSGPCSTARYF